MGHGTHKPGRLAPAALKTLGDGWHADGGNLYLFVRGDSRGWVFRFVAPDGKRRNMGLGSQHAISLAEARKQAALLREQVKHPTAPNDPLAARRELRLAQKLAKRKHMTFKSCALAYIEAHQAEWKNQKHCDQWEYTLSHYAFPVIGRKLLNEINTDDILCILQPIWAGKTTTASRLRSRIERILSAATVLKLRTGPNPSIWRGHLDTILPKPRKVSRVKHHKALPYTDLPQFIQELQAREAIAARALEFAILTAARTGEVIGAKRSEISGNVWCIPAERMKADREHRVPLSPRALTILRQAQRSKHDEDYLFSRNGKPLSNMAMLTLLKRMDVKVTVHGFRSSFRDWVAEETSHSGELAEMALAHTISNKVESAYRRGDLLVPRKQLMLDWEAYCIESVEKNVRLVAA